VRVTTAEEMLEACLKALPVDIAVCAAAVADFRPDAASDKKIKKTGKDPMTVRLVQNPDILATLSQSNRRPRLVVGFAAETHDGMENAQAKLVKKGCDWLVLNDVSGGQVFGAESNIVTLLQKQADGKVRAETWPQMSKKDVARDLVRQAALHLKA
jgi:phosphopantothenoylcysteine decarboxylase / phosphopantothenate---cysteine ligase